jgi:hypothetical protein
MRISAGRDRPEVTTAMWERPSITLRSRDNRSTMNLAITVLAIVLMAAVECFLTDQSVPATIGHLGAGTPDRAAATPPCAPTLGPISEAEKQASPLSLVPADSPAR